MVFFHSIRETILQSLKAAGQMELKLLGENSFHIKGNFNLDLCPTQFKSDVTPLLNISNHAMRV